MLYYRTDERGVKMYKRILLAYDGSVEGRTALRLLVARNAVSDEAIEAAFMTRGPNG
jgi:hypothetical protein